jgi:hypothetical protein
VPPRARFLFKHVLVQDIAYSMLLLGLRRSLHGQIARALEERFPDAMEGRPETLAHYFTEAGIFEKTIGYWCGAGRQSVAKSGFVEAITQLRTGLRLMADLPDTRERKQRELEVQIALAGALTVVKGYAHPEVAEASGRARSLITETGRAGAITHYSVLRGLWATDFVGGQPKAALDHANEFLSLAQSQPDSWVLATGHWLVGRVLITIGDYAAAISHLEHAVASHRAGEHRPLDPRLGADIGVTAAAAWALALWHRDYPIRRAGLPTRHPGAHGNSATLAYALLIIGLVAIPARKMARSRSSRMRIRCTVAWRELCGSGGAGMARNHEPGFHGLLAEALALTGAIEEGLTVLTGALAEAKADGARGADAELHRLRSDLLRQLPSPEWAEVEGCFPRRSPSHASKARGGSSCAPPSASPAC